MTPASSAVSLGPAAAVLASSASQARRSLAISSSLRWLAGLNSGGKTTDPSQLPGRSVAYIQAG
eukprot:2277486-Pleurochrysis_carterae.AAC.1